MIHKKLGGVKIAHSIGFCSGVTIAVKKTKKLLAQKKVYCIGDMVHNSFVINNLRKKGLIVVENFSQVPVNSKVIIRAHGLPVAIIEKLKKKNCRIFDFTCPTLKKIHRTLAGLKKANYLIVIIGNPLHAEVRTLISHAGTDSVVIENLENAKNFKSRRKIAVICQSTIPSEKFLKISNALRGKTNETRIIDTICREVKARRLLAEELAKNSKMVIIVGDKKSSNTVNLAKIVRHICPAVIIAQVNELREKKFSYPLGITSGASSPRELVLNIAGKIRETQMPRSASGGRRLRRGTSSA